ncbi:MAG: hypothetical protein ABIA91_01725 [Patescibacteria group bacterium]
MPDFLFSIRDVSMFDPCSLTHFLWWIIFGVLIFRLSTKYPNLKKIKYFLGIGFLTVIGWEIFEIINRQFNNFVQHSMPNSILTDIWGLITGYETWFNVLSDIVFGMSGILVVNYYIQKGKIKIQDLSLKKSFKTNKKFYYTTSGLTIFIIYVMIF